MCRRERDVKLGLRDNVRAPGVGAHTLCTACECVYLEADLLEELCQKLLYDVRETRVQCGQSATVECNYLRTKESLS